MADGGDANSDGMNPSSQNPQQTMGGSRPDKGWGAVIVKAKGGEVDEREASHEMKYAPASSNREYGVHKGGDGEGELKGRSAAGINAEWAGKHKNPVHAAQSLDYAKTKHAEKLSELQSMPKPNLPMAEGGSVEEDDRMLNQHGEYEEGPQSGGQGFHGESYMGNPGNSADNYQSESHEDDMVGRIMKMRQHMYSEGGRIANADHGEDQSKLAGFLPNEFDDLVLRDNLESSYTVANSGDEIGNAQEDADQNDIVSRIMKSRAKKDRLPNPR